MSLASEKTRSGPLLWQAGKPMKFYAQLAKRAPHARGSNTNDYSSTTSFSTISSLFTLFSKFFSPFLRSTCSLSVSHKYLALEEVYLPFRAAIPNNPTLRRRSLVPRRSRTTGLSPSMTSCSKVLMLRPSPLRSPRSRLQFQLPCAMDLHFELCPIHSPLLRAS